MTDRTSASGEHGHQTREEWKEAARDVREGARGAVRQGKEEARTFLEAEKELAADRVHGFAEALRSTARELEHEGGGTADLAGRAADGADRLAEALRRRDLGSLVREAESLARRAPGVFVGGSVAVGFLVSRFLKSSREREPRGRRGKFRAGDEFHAGDGAARRDQAWDELRPEPRPGASAPTFSAGSTPGGGPQ